MGIRETHEVSNTFIIPIINFTIFYNRMYNYISIDDPVIYTITTSFSLVIAIAVQSKRSNFLFLLLVQKHPNTQWPS